MAADNWALTIELFNNTLCSIFNQTDPEFRVFVACHEKPELVKEFDNRLNFITVDFPPPRDVSQQTIDKYYKKRILVHQVQQIGGQYIMFVDADDYISKNILAWVKKNNHPSGWLINAGYEYDFLFNKMRTAPNFNRICGTSAILNISSIKEEVVTEFTDYVRQNKYFFDFSHNDWNLYLQEHNMPIMGIVPFKAAIYVINTGENLSQKMKMSSGFLRILYRALHFNLKLNKQFRDEFNFRLA